VLVQLREVRINERPPVDRAFAKYLRATARFQEGDRSQATLTLMREAYSEAQSLALPAAARTEMARNLVLIMRATERDWERDPLLNNRAVQAVLVEDVQ